MSEQGSKRMQEEWVAVARLLRPQGRRGELLADPLTDVAEVLGAGVELHLAAGDASEPVSGAPVVLENLWHPTGRNAARIVIKLHGCDDISAAETFAGKQLMIAADKLPALEEDTFYVRDLLGCTLWDGEREGGEIVDVHFVTTADGRRLPDAAPLLEVRPVDAEQYDTALVPFIRAHLVHVDFLQRRVTMHLPAGLLHPEE